MPSSLPGHPLCSREKRPAPATRSAPWKRPRRGQLQPHAGGPGDLEEMGAEGEAAWGPDGPGSGSARAGPQSPAPEAGRPSSPARARGTARRLALWAGFRRRSLPKPPGTRTLPGAATLGAGRYSLPAARGSRPELRPGPRPPPPGATGER